VWLVVGGLAGLCNGLLDRGELAIGFLHQAAHFSLQLCQGSAGFHVRVLPTHNVDEGKRFRSSSCL
jgi:hypothetical protein